MTEPLKKYYAKLMIAGEYGVIAGSEALTVPLKEYYAILERRDNSSDHEAVVQSVSSLREIFYYIKSLPGNSFYAHPQINEMEAFLKKGYYIHSNIPRGYGIGSSGAVTALLYDQFFDGKDSLNDHQLRKDLATIESHYHGKSSGVDGMSCYKGVPLHFLEGEQVNYPLKDPLTAFSDYRFFLLDSGEIMDTGPLVKIFLEKMRNKDYRNVIVTDYIPLIQKMISTLTGQLRADPALVFRAISDFQWKNLREMIPASVEDEWINGQVSNSYYLKINGSGGGFLLGIAPRDSEAEIETMLSAKKLTWL